MKNSLTILAILFTLTACIKEDEESITSPTTTTTSTEGAYGSSPTASCIYSGDDVAIRPIAILPGDRRPGNPIKFTVANGGGVSYECRGGYSWNFGDGSVGSGYELYHAFSSPGKYVVTLTATSLEGITSTATRSYTIL